MAEWNKLINIGGLNTIGSLLSTANDLLSPIDGALKVAETFSDEEPSTTATAFKAAVEQVKKQAEGLSEGEVHSILVHPLNVGRSGSEQLIPTLTYAEATQVLNASLRDQGDLNRPTYAGQVDCIAFLIAANSVEELLQLLSAAEGFNEGLAELSRRLKLMQELEQERLQTQGKSTPPDWQKIPTSKSFGLEDANKACQEQLAIAEGYASGTEKATVALGNAVTQKRNQLNKAKMATEKLANSLKLPPEMLAITVTSDVKGLANQLQQADGAPHGASFCVLDVKVTPSAGLNIVKGVLGL